MPDDLLTPAALVHIAALFQIAGFLVRDQVWLRTLVLTGTMLYIVYYYFAPDIPLWDAIFWSTVMGLANIYVLVKLVLERTTLALSDEEKTLYYAFASLSPGEYRRILKVAEWHDADGEAVLTHEGQPLDRLYYVLDGKVRIEKGERKFHIPPGSFIGEVAYFLKQNASATAVVEPGGRYVAVKRADLETIEKRHPAIRIALHSMLSMDMAAKVAAG